MPSAAATGRGMEAAVDTYGSEYPWVILHRSDHNDGTTGPAFDASDEPEGWPW